MRLLLFAQHINNEDIPSIKLLIEEAQKANIKLFACGKVFSKLLETIQSQDVETVKEGSFSLRNEFDAVISLGGDGTMLGAVMVVKDQDIPILGINFGRLGFLAHVEKSYISTCIHKLVTSNFHIEERTMLYLESEPQLFHGESFALNDFTLHKRDTSSMITIHAYINGDYLNSYWADGLIVSTPTGSSGYSLSCGGPIVFPNSGNFVITPVAPHNLNVRPLVISDKSVISFEIEGRSDSFLCTLDSRFQTITSDHQLAVRKNDFNTKLISFNDLSFLKSLQQKLSWGSDPRNK